MRVYLVIEHWDNQEAYEDFSCTESVIAVAGNQSIADEVIQKRRQELIDIAANHKDMEVTMDDLLAEGINGIMFSSRFQIEDLFGTHSFGSDMFAWRIEEHEVKES